MTLSFNPVALKELRQLVRSRLITFALVLYPVLLLVVTILTLSASMHGESPAEIAFGRGHGQPPFIACSIVTGLIACIAIPLFAAIKAALETGKDRIPLEFTTSLTPGQIIGGKMTAAAILMAAVIAVSMPFFTLAYLMRGLSLGETFIMPPVLFAAGLATFTIALPIATSRNIAVPVRIILLIMLLILVPPFASLIISIVSIRSHHYGASPAPAVISVLATIKPYVLGVLGLLSLIVISRAQCAAQLSPPHVDGERTMRKSLVVLMLLSAIVIPLEYEPWSVFWGIIGMVVCMRSAFNPHPMPRAARAMAPRSFIGRLVSFPFTTDACSGLLLGLVILLTATIPIAFDDMSDAMRMICVISELVGLMIIANGISRAAGFGPRGYRIVGIVSIVWIAFANFSNILAETNALPKDLAHLLPCNIAGVGEMEAQHTALAFVSLVIALPILIIGNVRSFRKYRRAN